MSVLSPRLIAAASLSLLAVSSSAWTQEETRWETHSRTVGGEPVDLRIADKTGHYLYVAPGGGITFEASGGERIRVSVRRQMKPGDTQERPCRWFLARDLAAPVVRGTKQSIDVSASVPSRPGVVVSRATTSEFAVPAGTHTYHVSVSHLAKSGMYIKVQRPAPPRLKRTARGPRKPAEPVHWRFTAKPGLELTYDSNVFRFSDSQIRRFEDDRNHPRFGNVSSIEDLVTKPAVDLLLRNDFVEGSPTVFEVMAKGYVYAENDRKNHLRTLAEVKQSLGTDDVVRFQWIREHDVFDRTRFTTIRPRRYEASVFDQDALTFRYAHDFTRTISADVNYRYEWKDFNGEFDERDQTAHLGEIRVKVDFKRWWEARVGYAYEVADARAANEDPGRVYTDPSSFAHVVTLENGFRLSRRFTLDLGWEHTERHYTEDDPLDRTRFHRDDKKDEFRARLTYAPRPGVECWLEGSHSQLKTDLGSTDGGGDDDLGYEDGQVSIGIEIGF